MYRDTITFIVHRELCTIIVYLLCFGVHFAALPIRTVIHNSLLKGLCLGKMFIKLAHIELSRFG